MKESTPYVCTLSEKTLEKAKRELNEDPEERPKQIAALREWIQSQPHIHTRTDDAFLLRFLRGAKFNQLRAQQVLENFWTARTVPSRGVPEWFEDLNPANPRIQEVLDLGIAVPLPEKDDEGRQVILIRAGAYDPKECSVAEILKVCFINNDSLLLDEENQVNGFQTILDFTGFSSSHIWYYSRDTLSKAIKCWMDTYPMRQQGSHYVNAPYIFNAVYELLVYFARDKNRKRMNLHRSIESLHSMVPKRILPTHLGGDVGDIEELSERWKQHVIKQKEEFDINSQYGILLDKMPEKTEKSSNGWSRILFRRPPKHK